MYEATVVTGAEFEALVKLLPAADISVVKEPEAKRPVRGHKEKS